MPQHHHLQRVMTILANPMNHLVDSIILQGPSRLGRDRGTRVLPARFDSYTPTVTIQPKSIYELWTTHASEIRSVLPGFGLEGSLTNLERTPRSSRSVEANLTWCSPTDLSNEDANSES